MAVHRARRQPTSRMAHIAYLGGLSPTTLDPRQIEQFKVGLAENGLVEGQNITVDYLWGQGSTERLQQLAAELAQRDLDVIVTSGPQPVRALLAANTKTPIVFAILADPISDGFVQVLRALEAISPAIDVRDRLGEQAPRSLETAVPTISKVMVLHDPSMGPTGLSEVKTGARFLGLELFVVEASDDAKFTETFAGVAAQGINGMATMASPFLNFRRKRLIELAAQHHLPSIWENSAYVRDGGCYHTVQAFPICIAAPRGTWPRSRWPKTCRPPGGATDQIRASRQCANRQDPWSRNPIDATHARR